MTITPLLLTALASVAAGPAPGAAPSPPERAPALEVQEPKGDDKETRKERAAKEKAAVARLKAGLKSDQANERQAALVDAAETPYPAVIKALGDAVSDRDPQVAMIAAELLGRMEQQEAVETLRRCATRGKKALAKNPELQREVIRAIGRHRDPKSISMLIKGAFSEKDRATGRARVFAVANLRSKESAAAIFGEMRKADEKRLRGWLASIRPALIHVTGTDAGQDPARWLQWWESNRRTFEVPEQPPKLTGTFAEQWARFWGEDRTYERRKKRGDRG
ncbi:MAG: HEAT repeat domain-containing protein [Planctomycetota bacterium]|jgi:hypothetical protein